MRHSSPRTAIVPMTMRHYDRVAALWRLCPDMFSDDSDSRPRIRAYLRRSAGMSLVALEGRRAVGALLCGHDGRRGILHHLAVAPSHRRRGLGRRLVDRAVRSLRRAAIRKCWILVWDDNRAARRFWKSAGWRENPHVLYAARALTRT